MVAKILDDGFVRPLRFGVVGAINTAVGMAVILLGITFGLNDVSANVAGYAAGLTLSFLLNRHWTFRHADRIDAGLVLRYLTAFLLAYAINIAIVMAFVSYGFTHNILVHLMGMAIYTIVFYLACARFVFSPAGTTIARVPSETGAKAGNTLFRKWWPEVLAAIALALAFAELRHMPVTHDVVWQFWIARQMLHGAKLYVDILEINPPMWFWSALPFEALSELTNIPAKHMAVIVVFGLVAGSVGLLSRLWPTNRPTERAAGLLLACACLIIVPLADFGQREHLALIGALPYIVLTARRGEGRLTHPALAMLTGLIAAYGFSLKHYFVAVPVLLELWLAFRCRREWRPVRPETVTLAIVALLYAVALWYFAPGFFTNILPMIRLAYDGYAVPLDTQLTRLWVFVWALGAISIVLAHRRLTPITQLTALAALAFIFSYFAQQKGWRYHALSASGCLAFATGLTVFLRHGEKKSPLRNAGLLLACALLISFGLAAGPYSNKREEAAALAMAQAKPGDSVAVLSVNATIMWPTLDDAGLVWPLRHFAYWMIPSIATTEAKFGPANIPADMLELEQQIQQDTATDLWCRPPKLLVVDDVTKSPSLRGVDFDILKFMRRNSAFDDLMHYYQKTKVVGRLTVYSRIRAVSTPVGLTCRPIAPPRPPVTAP